MLETVVVQAFFLLLGLGYGLLLCGIIAAVALAVSAVAWVARRLVR